MKNFRDLTAAQKKRAIDQTFDIMAQDLANGSKGKSWAKLSQKKQQDIIDVQGYLCGCSGCLTSVKNFVKNDRAIKEFILGEAMVMAENAYYSEQMDTVIAVD